MASSSSSNAIIMEEEKTMDVQDWSAGNINIVYSKETEGDSIAKKAIRLHREAKEQYAITISGMYIPEETYIIVGEYFERQKQIELLANTPSALPFSTELVYTLLKMDDDYRVLQTFIYQCQHSKRTLENYMRFVDAKEHFKQIGNKIKQLIVDIDDNVHVRVRNIVQNLQNITMDD